MCQIPCTWWSDRHGLWEAMASLFSAGDLVVPTGTRVALYEALAQEDGLTAQRTTIGGRDVIAITPVRARQRASSSSSTRPPDGASGEPRCSPVTRRPISRPTG
jgi:hypothetical protein